MNRPIAVVDTDVLITLLDTTGDPDILERRAFIELTIERLTKQSVRWVVPAPVIAELCRDGKGSEQLRTIVRTMMRGLRIEVLDEDAADVAGEMHRIALQARRPGSERGAVKYDALIAGIAHNIGAHWLLTGNGDHMRACLNAIRSSVEVLVATEPPASGQQVMIHVLKPGATKG